MGMLATAVNGLKKLDTILPAVQALGERHVGYGTEDGHYDIVGAALLFTLGKGLGDGFTPDVEAAWTKAYMTLASVMKDAAAKTRAARADRKSGGTGKSVAVRVDLGGGSKIKQKNEKYTLY